MEAKLLRIKCLTNLHVGSGDINFNIVDQEVEKDITGYPVIHASGVKGAFRDNYEGKNGKDAERIFGRPGDQAGDGSSGGAYKFFDAKFLSRPLRVGGNSSMAFIPVTSVPAINELIETTTAFGCCPPGLHSISVDFGEKDFLVGKSVAKNIEGSRSIGTLDQEIYRMLCPILGENFALGSEINGFDLPVIARNALDDKGISKNLWYEEYVPHHSEFWLIVLTPDGKFDIDLSSYIQFGGNASVGYGYTKVEAF